MLLAYIPPPPPIPISPSASNNETNVTRHQRVAIPLPANNSMHGLSREFMNARKNSWPLLVAVVVPQTELRLSYERERQTDRLRQRVVTVDRILHLIYCKNQTEWQQFSPYAFFSTSNRPEQESCDCHGCRVALFCAECVPWTDMVVVFTVRRCEWMRESSFSVQSPSTHAPRGCVCVRVFIIISSSLYPFWFDFSIFLKSLWCVYAPVKFETTCLKADLSLGC